MKTQNTIEEIARQVRQEIPLPQIVGRGHAERVAAPRNKAVWRVLAAAELSTSRGSRCGFAAKAHVLETVRRAAALGLVWDWDGRLAREEAAAREAARQGEERARREALYAAAGGDAARDEWFKLNPSAAGNCLPGSGQYLNRIRRNFINHLEKSA